LDRICQIINSTDTDIVNLQQVHSYDVLLNLKKRLPNFKYIVFIPALLGPQAGLAVFSRYPFVKNEFMSFNKASRVIGLNTKGVLVATLKNGAILINVHLSANTEGDWSNKSKFYPMHETELLELREIINSKSQETPILLSGDFNIAGDSELFQRFIAETGLNDSLKGDLRPTFHKEFLPAGEPGRRIDQILTTGRTVETIRLFDEIVSFRGVKMVYLSDHIGLYASIDIASPSMKALAP
jgi:endonuclease/exonuclease/phosphatase family metal-dependent hydrolase